MSDDKIGWKIGLVFCGLMFLGMIIATFAAPPNDKAAFGGLAILFFFLACGCGGIAFTQKKDQPSTNP